MNLELLFNADSKEAAAVAASKLHSLMLDVLGIEEINTEDDLRGAVLVIDPQQEAAVREGVQRVFGDLNFTLSETDAIATSRGL